MSNVLRIVERNAKITLVLVSLLAFVILVFLFRYYSNIAEQKRLSALATNDDDSNAGGSTVYAPQVLSPQSGGLFWTKISSAEYKGAPNTIPQQSRASTSIASINDMYANTLALGANAFVWDGASGVYQPCIQGPRTTQNTLLVFYNAQYYFCANTDADWKTSSPRAISNITYDTLLKQMASDVSSAAVLISGSFNPSSNRATLITCQVNNIASLLNTNSSDVYSTYLYGGSTFPYSYTFTSYKPPLLN